MWIGFHWWTASGLHIVFTVGVMEGRGAIRIFALNKGGRELGWG